MKKLKQIKLGALLVGASMLVSAPAMSNGYYNSAKHDQYEITITNLTYGQVFSPPLVVSHTPRVALFKAGEEASVGIATMAEGGNTQPIIDSVSGNRQVRGATAAAGPIPPGHSATITVPVNYGRVVSAVAMLVNTNDAFMGLNSVRAPYYRGHTVSYDVLAYDAGSEPNDELCAHIPGPACGGAGDSPDAGGEGFIHVHRGVHGGADLNPADHDWRNPVARVTIKRVRGANK